MGLYDKINVKPEAVRKNILPFNLSKSIILI